jgi:phasin family protein
LQIYVALQYIAVHNKHRLCNKAYFRNISFLGDIKMQNEFFEKMTEMSKASYNAFQELTSINSKALKEISELQMGLATYSLDTGVELTKTLSGTTNYNDAISAEADFASEYGNQIIEFGRKTADVLTDSRDEVVNWVEKAVEDVTTESKSVAKATSKKAAA